MMARISASKRETPPFIVQLCLLLFYSTDELNLYALDYPTCTDYKSRRFSSVGGDIDKAHTGAAAVSGSQGHALKRHVRRALYDAYGGGAHRMLGELHDSSYDPCAEDYLVT